MLGAFRSAGCHHGEVRDVGVLVWLVLEYDGVCRKCILTG